MKKKKDITSRAALLRIMEAATLLLLLGAVGSGASQPPFIKASLPQREGRRSVHFRVPLGSAGGPRLRLRARPSPPLPQPDTRRPMRR